MRVSGQTARLREERDEDLDTFLTSAFAGETSAVGPPSSTIISSNAPRKRRATLDVALEHQASTAEIPIDPALLAESPPSKRPRESESFSFGQSLPLPNHSPFCDSHHEFHSCIEPLSTYSPPPTDEDSLDQYNSAQAYRQSLLFGEATLESWDPRDPPFYPSHSTSSHPLAGPSHAGPSLSGPSHVPGTRNLTDRDLTEIWDGQRLISKGLTECMRDAEGTLEETANEGFNEFPDPEKNEEEDQIDEGEADGDWEDAEEEEDEEEDWMYEEERVTGSGAAARVNGSEEQTRKESEEDDARWGVDCEPEHPAALQSLIDQYRAHCDDPSLPISEDVDLLDLIHSMCPRPDRPQPLTRSELIGILLDPRYFIGVGMYEQIPPRIPVSLLCPVDGCGVKLPPQTKAQHAHSFSCLRKRIGQDMFRVWSTEAAKLTECPFLDCKEDVTRGPRVFAKHLYAHAISDTRLDVECGVMMADGRICGKRYVLPRCA